MQALRPLFNPSHHAARESQSAKQANNNRANEWGNLGQSGHEHPSAFPYPFDKMASYL